MSSEHLDRLLEQWEEAAAEGFDLPADELCGDDPQLADELERHIQTLRWMRRALLDLGEPTGPLRR